MEKRFVLTADQLTQALKDAAAAHHVYEAGLGHADENWPAWYAQFVADAAPLRADVQPVPALLVDGRRAKVNR